MSFILLYVNVKNQQEAISIAKSLLEKQLIACANISSPVTSLYRWEGQLQEEAEVILFAKTTRERREEAMNAIKTLHSYECPCILALPIEDINDDFARWIKNCIN